MTEPDLVKVLFALEPDEDGWPPAGSERLWAEPVGGDEYRIDNTPWYVRDLAADDVVCATPHDGELWAVERVRASGRMTIRVVPLGEGQPDVKVQRILEVVRPLGVRTEGSLPGRIVALDVGPESDVVALKQWLRVPGQVCDHPPMETLGPEASRQLWQSAAELIRADLEATTDLRWELLVELEPFWAGEGELCFSYGSSGIGLWRVPTEQSWADAVATGEIPGGETVLGAASAELADRVSEDVTESLQTPWPECNVHRRPMDPIPVGPTGLWRCAKAPRHEIAIGSLAAHVDERRRLTF